VTRAELNAFFPFTWGAPVNMGAASYAVPTLAWLRGPFYDAFRQRYWDENLQKWKKRWECRDFASAYRIMAIECWATSEQVVSEDDGLAVGEIWFRPSPENPLGHAINPVFTENGLQYIDPQTNQLWDLTPAQFASRYYLRF
jgi:hypothetical protein